MARLKYNALSAVLATDVDAVATAVTFAAKLKEYGQTDIPAIASPDTLTLYRAGEVIWVTAYDPVTLAATVLRGQEDSTAVAHTAADTATSPFKHGPTKADLASTGGGGSGVVLVSVIGTGGGNHTTTSATFANIHASMYDCVVPAVAGDKLLITFEAQWFQSATGNSSRLRFTVAGTPISGMPTTGLSEGAHDANSHFTSRSWPYTVQSGDLSGGNVTVRPQFATDAGTLSIRNDGTNGKPFMRVLNTRQ